MLNINILIKLSVFYVVATKSENNRKLGFSQFKLRKYGKSRT